MYTACPAQHGMWNSCNNQFIFNFSKYYSLVSESKCSFL